MTTTVKMPEPADSTKAIKDALEAGRTLATIAFNLSQYTAEPIKPEWAATMRDAYKAWDQAKPAINGLLSRLEEAERDAKRYQWLRHCNAKDSGPLFTLGTLSGETLDEAIDEAMKEQSE